MTPLFKKLNYKGQPEILLLNGPDSFAPERSAMSAFTAIHETLGSGAAFTFAIVFVTRQADIDALTPRLDAALKGDAVLWFAYPKGTSKTLRCDFNRDSGWEILGRHGFEVVRQVAIDADWTALRFRRVAYIKTMTRRKAMSITPAGKEKTSGK